MENEIKQEDKLFKFILKCCKNYNKPDLHSFEIKIKNGIAWVECRQYEVYIETHQYKGIDTRWVGTPMAAANRLDTLQADYNTIDM